MKLKPIHQQVVVVCGASSGIGREAARMFARKGAKVVVSSRSQDGLDSLVAQIEEQGGEAMAVVADVSDYSQVKNVAFQALEHYGRIDTWAHFAGTSLYAPFRETTPEEFQRVVDVNLMGAVFAAMVALPQLSRQGGALIEISSVEAEIGAPYQSAYTASKHGMRGFLDVVRMELEHERVPVSVTNIVPSGINTPFFNHARSKLGFKAAPPSRLYQPEVVVRAVLHAAEHPMDEIVIGGSGGFLLGLKRFLPRLANALMSRSVYREQRGALSGISRLPEENIFQPGTADTRIHGDFDEYSHQSSAYTWLQMHPGIRRTIGGALLAGAATALILSGRER